MSLHMPTLSSARTSRPSLAVAGFANAELGSKEGFVQYYTARALERLRHWLPAALRSKHFCGNGQHPTTNRNPGEPISRRGGRPPRHDRTRRWREGKVEQFERRLERAAEEFKPLREVCSTEWVLVSAEGTTAMNAVRWHLRAIPLDPPGVIHRSLVSSIKSSSPRKIRS